MIACFAPALMQKISSVTPVRTIYHACHNPLAFAVPYLCPMAKFVAIAYPSRLIMTPLLPHSATNSLSTNWCKPSSTPIALPSVIILGNNSFNG